MFINNSCLLLDGKIIRENYILMLPVDILMSRLFLVVILSTITFIFITLFRAPINAQSSLCLLESPRSYLHYQLHDTNTSIVS